MSPRTGAGQSSDGRLDSTCGVQLRIVRVRFYQRRGVRRIWPHVSPSTTKIRRPSRLGRYVLRFCAAENVSAKANNVNENLVLYQRRNTTKDALFVYVWGCFSTPVFCDASANRKKPHGDGRLIRTNFSMIFGMVIKL